MYNVSIPVLKARWSDEPPLRVIEVPAGEPAVEGVVGQALGRRD